MSPEDLNSILGWIGTPGVINDLPVEEMLCVQMAAVKFATDVKPIYDKHHKTIIKLEGVKNGRNNK